MNKPASMPDFYPAEANGTKSSLGLRSTRELLQQQRQMELRDYWQLLLLRRWLIAAFVVAAAIAMTVATFLMKPVYQASATMLIEPTKAQVSAQDDGLGGNSAARDYVQTQVEVLKSREVAQRVIQALDLRKQREFDPDIDDRNVIQRGLSAALKQLGLDSEPAATDAVKDELDHAAMIDRFESRLTVEPLRQSQLLRISFESRDPALAALAANGVVQAYIQTEIDARTRTVKNSSAWLQLRVKELKEKLDVSERKLQDYRESMGLVDDKGAYSGNRRQADELTHRLVEARVRRSEAEEAYNQVKAAQARGNLDSVPAVIRSPAVLRVRDVQADAERRAADAEIRFGHNHPAYIDAMNDLKAAKANTARITQSIVDSVVKEYTAAKAIEQSIADELARSKDSIQDANRKGIDESDLLREVDSNRQIYQTFLGREKELAAADTQMSSARLLEWAVAPVDPIKPAKFKLISVASALGLFAGIAAALLFSHLADTMNSRQDVESKLRLPLLAALPVFERDRNIKAGRASIDYPDSAYAEAIRTAATGILLSAIEVPRKVVCVTSSVPEEGKSTFSLNLSTWQANTRSVLLLDADMRRPTVGKAFGIAPAQPGLSELMQAQASLNECLVRIPGTRLDVLVAGQPPANPLELLVNERFDSLIAALSDRYEMVIIDCPPLQPVSDALVIGTHATGVVFVVDANKTPASVANDALSRLSDAGIPVFGIALNRRKLNRTERRYSNYYRPASSNGAAAIATGSMELPAPTGNPASVA